MRYHLLAFSLVLSMSCNALAEESNKMEPSNQTAYEGVVNWDAPKKQELVERAISDGISNPTKIVKWAKDHGVTMTVKEVRKIKAKLNKK